jgi:hypothetical protein
MKINRRTNSIHLNQKLNKRYIQENEFDRKELLLQLEKSDDGLKRSKTNTPKNTLNKNKLDYNINNNGSMQRNSSFEKLGSKKYANED